MASRQIRLNTAALIRQKLPEIYGKYANIVMRSAQVYFVKVIRLNADILEVSDMRSTKNKLRIDDIAEIIIDTPA